MQEKQLDSIKSQEITINNKLLSRKEAADYLGIEETTLACWASNKRYPLPFIKIGRLAKYRQQHLDEFIEQNTVH